MLCKSRVIQTDPTGKHVIQISTGKQDIDGADHISRDITAANYLDHEMAT